MIVNELSRSDSVVNQIIKELRDVQIQHDRYRFRKNIERFGMIAGYEISKQLNYKDTVTHTPLGESPTRELEEQPIIATVLRAGLPLQNGVSNMFNQADLAFISAYRKHEDAVNFSIVVEYIATPPLHQRTLILTDPMLATGQSLTMVYEQFLKHGEPKNVHLVSLIGSAQGVAYVNERFPDATLWIGVIDPFLNEFGYIVPGLGDAGDLSFGVKE